MNSNAPKAKGGILSYGHREVLQHIVNGSRPTYHTSHLIQVNGRGYNPTIVADLEILGYITADHKPTEKGKRFRVSKRKAFGPVVIRDGNGA